MEAQTSKSTKADKRKPDLVRQKIEELGLEPAAGNSELLLFHRPTKQTLELLKEIKGITLVISAQDDHESVGDVVKLAGQEGLQHYWIKLRGANQALLNDQKVVKKLRKQITEVF